MKKLAEKSGEEQPVKIKKEEPCAPASDKKVEVPIVFNKVETVEEAFVDKMLKKKEKKRSVKGQITPLTGKNYKQLLGRVEARKAKLEQLREKNEEKACAMEEKMKWTNILYKAEGIKIKDDEDMLRASLKRKEKMEDNSVSVSAFQKRKGERCFLTVTFSTKTTVIHNRELQIQNSLDLKGCVCSHLLEITVRL